MRSDQRAFVLSLALAGSLLASVATPASAAELTAANEPFLKFELANVLVSGTHSAADAFVKF